MAAAAGSAAGTTAYLPLVKTLVGGIPAGSYIQEFTGSPSAPQPWTPPDWDVTVHTRGIATSFPDMQAAHGSDCSAPPATHLVSNYADAVFLCKNHMMTAINAPDYGTIYLTPNQMVDFSTGEAIVRWDMSTLRTSDRDWVDVWITPYDDNLQLPLNLAVDMNGPPRNSVHFEMDFARAEFTATVFKNFSNVLTTDHTYVGYEDFLVPDAARRDTFEIRMSRTHLKIGMPNYGYWWVDTPIDDLGWDRGVVQFGHHSYNPTKLCNTPCGPNTWHWDNIIIGPAQPFTIIPGNRLSVDPGNNSTPVGFAKPAPDNAHLRFTGTYSQLQVSYDGGQDWIEAQIQQQSEIVQDHFQSYWMPIPPGTSSVLFRSTDSQGWQVRSISIWSPTPS
jgi:hypothetical protein